MSFLKLILRDRGRGRQTDRQTSICCSTHLRVYIHWLILGCALTRDRIRNLGMSGRHLNQVSYPAMAGVSFIEPLLVMFPKHFCILACMLHTNNLGQTM